MGGVIAALLWRPLLMSLRFCVFVPLFLGAWAMELLLTVRAMHEHTCSRVTQRLEVSRVNRVLPGAGSQLSGGQCPHLTPGTEGRSHVAMHCSLSPSEAPLGITQ